MTRNSDSDADADDSSVTCDECGDVVDTSTWYPVVSCAETSYEIYHFCDRACRDAWLDSNC
ncbi:MAG: hypothetical protein ABEI57_03795 [Halapricum sp.]